LKYCPSKRMKCYHTVSRDTSCRPHEILKLKIKDIVFKLSPDKTKQYAEVLVNGKTGSRNIPLINSIPYVKDYLTNEHPQPSNPDAAFICGLRKRQGMSISNGNLLGIYTDYKNNHFPRLLQTDIPQQDKDNIKELLKKPWNPYIRRHSGLTEKSLKIPGLMNQYAGWVEGSMMSQKYFHYFGNESSNGLLEAYGIVPKDNEQSEILKPKQCPNCSEPNKPDSKFCAKCRMVLTYDAYNETLENQKERESEVKRLQEKYEQDMKSVREEMENKFQQILTKIDTGKLG
jgi:integrase/recombinase XerD